MRTAPAATWLGSSRWPAALPWLALWLAILPVAASQLGPRVIASAEQIIAAVRASSLHPAFKAYAADIAGLAIKLESGGNLGIYNGTCCTGVLQVNRGGLARYCHCTPSEYARMSLQQQINVWAELTNANGNNGIVRGLMNRGTFDGRAVDGAMVLSCIQIGPGHCRRTLQAGTCATRAGADGNGKNFCDFAAAIRGGASGTVVATGPAAGSDPGGGADPRMTGGPEWSPISAEDAFLNGAGVDMGEVKGVVSGLIGTALLLWLAWVSQAQASMFRGSRTDLLTAMRGIVSATVLVLLVAWIVR
jgi:hypothetical protein